MDSDESAHSESEFYYPEEETLNQMTPINLFPNFKKKKSSLGWSALEKTVPLVLSTGLEPYSRPKAQFFSHRDLPPGK